VLDRLDVVDLSVAAADDRAQGQCLVLISVRQRGSRFLGIAEPRSRELIGERLPESSSYRCCFVAGREGSSLGLTTPSLELQPESRARSPRIAKDCSIGNGLLPLPFFLTDFTWSETTPVIWGYNPRRRYVARDNSQGILWLWRCFTLSVILQRALHRGY